MADSPTFFFSYARQDTEAPGGYLLTFFSDLEKRLATYAGIDLKEGPLGTLDRRIAFGADWDAELCTALAKNRAFVAILTPLYFNRANCGKELGVFVLRSRKLSIDANGALMGVENVVPIRWLSQEAYADSSQRDARIPSILRRIQDSPADPGDDPELTAVIKRYQRRGMEGCVGTPAYLDLLNLFAARLRDMSELPAASSNLSFATAKNAFAYDWRQHFKEPANLNDAQQVVAEPPLTPQPLASVVLFYVTAHAFTTALSGSAEAELSISAVADPPQNELLADVRAACLADNFTLFQLVTEAPLLEERLAAHSNAGVITALMLDPEIWPVGSNAQIESVIRSTSWAGPVLLPDLGAGAADEAALSRTRDLPPRLVALPQDSVNRVATLRRIFVAARGRALQRTATPSSDAERLPLLTNVSAGMR